MGHSLLAVFAHPDDEAFGTGGTLARYASEGVATTLVCATRGEVGEIAEGTGATPETLGEVRERELRCAAETVGVREVIFLDYRDSGMAGAPENDHPQAFVNAPAEQVVPQLVAIIRRVRPEVVVTFEPNGGYGHPDHLAIHRHTVEAFHVAADAARYPDLGPAWQASRLYYTAIPRSFFRRMADALQSAGVDLSEYGWLFEANDDRGWPDENITAVVDVSDTVEAKWQALQCHRTQFGPKNLFRLLPESTVKEMLRAEHFSQAWPPRNDESLASSLFE